MAGYCTKFLDGHDRSKYKPWNCLDALKNYSATSGSVGPLEDTGGHSVSRRSHFDLGCEYTCPSAKSRVRRLTHSWPTIPIGLLQNLGCSWCNHGDMETTDYFTDTSKLKAKGRLSTPKLGFYQLSFKRATSREERNLTSSTAIGSISPQKHA